MGELNARKGQEQPKFTAARQRAYSKRGHEGRAGVERARWPVCSSRTSGRRWMLRQRLLHLNTRTLDHLAPALDFARHIGLQGLGG